MSTLFTRFASALTALALIASFVPAAAYAQIGEEAPAEIIADLVIPAEPAAPAADATTPVAPAAPATPVTDTTSADDAQTSSEDRAVTVAPVYTSDNGTFDTMFSTGSVNTQHGWTVTNSSFDQEIVDNQAAGGPEAFGLKALRFSNSYASGSFGDQMFAAPLAGSVGENGATAGSFPAGVRDNHFEMSFDFVSTMATEQPGLTVNLSPDRGDGSRMSFVRLTDTATGIDVALNEVKGGTVPEFVETVVKTGLDRTAVHNVKLTFDAVNGPSNDVVKVYVDGVLVHTGTSWEDYYRYAGVVEPTPRIVKTLLFRANTAAGVAGKGFLFDHVALSASRNAETTTVTNKTVRSVDLETAAASQAKTNGSGKWFFYNDETDVIDNALGSFVTGPATAPLGEESVQISVTGTERRNLATYAYAGTKLADITTLKYSTYNASAGNGAAASAKRAGYLQFNVAMAEAPHVSPRE